MSSEQQELVHEEKRSSKRKSEDFNEVPGPAQEQKEKIDLRILYNALAEFKSKWLQIGIGLGIPRSKLMEFKDDIDPFSAVLDYWLRGNVPESVVPITWHSIVEVLESPTIDESAIARQIRKEFIKSGEAKAIKERIDRKLLSEIENGDCYSLNKLLSDPPSIDPKTFRVNDQEETFLHLACSKGHLHLVCTLIEVYFCDLKPVDKFGNSAFHTACANIQLKVVQYLCSFRNCLPFTFCNNDGDTVLHVACQTGSVPLVRIILHDLIFKCAPVKLNLYFDDILLYAYAKNSVSFNNFIYVKWVNHHGFHPIHTACYYGNLSLLRFFVYELYFYMKSLWLFLEMVPSLLAIACDHNHFLIIDFLHSLAEQGIDTCVNPSSCNTAVATQCLADLANVFKYVHATPIAVEPSLFLAVRRANVSLYQHLKNSKVSSKRGDTLLHAACASCSLDMVKEVFVSDYKDQTNEVGNTCLHVACEWGASPEIIQFLCDKKVNVEEKNCLDQQLFHLSIIYERYDVFENLLESDRIDVNAATKDGETPLHLATYHSYLLPFVKKILEHHNFESFESINFRDKYGDTPIFNACRTGNFEMICLLAKVDGCDLLAKNNANETIANIACRKRLTEVLDWLFEKVSSYPSNLKNHLGQTLLQIACRSNNLDMIFNHNAIYDLCEDINLADEFNDLTPLQYACIQGNVELVEDLLKVSECDADFQNKAGDTVLHICCRRNLKKMSDVFKEHCSLTIKNKDHDTPLHVACKNKRFELALILLESKHGKSFRLTDLNNDGNTVLHLAAKSLDAAKLVKYLVDNCICDHNARNKLGNTALHEIISNHYLCEENALYLFSIEYDIESWYNHEHKSPLYLAARDYSHHKLLASVISKKLLKPVDLVQRCVRIPHPFKSLLRTVHFPENDVDMPLVHFLIYCAFYELQHHWGYNNTCSHCGRCNVLELMESDPSLLDMVDSQGCTIFHYLAFTLCPLYDPVIAKAFKLCKINPMQLDHFDNSPLHFACLCCNDQMGYQLLQHTENCDVLNGRNRLKRTPMDFLIEATRERNDSSQLGSYLIANGSDSSHCDNMKSNSRQSCVNVFIVGNGSVGKSTLLTTLKEMLNPQNLAEITEPISAEEHRPKHAKDPDPTTGIVTEEVTNHTSGHSYNFHDFGGQVQFEASHSVWLDQQMSAASKSLTPPPFIFFVLVKATDSFDDNKKHIVRWLTFICRHAKANIKNIYLILICTHDDLLSDNKLRQERKSELKKYLEGCNNEESIHDIIGSLVIDIHDMPIFINGRKLNTASLSKLVQYLEKFTFVTNLSSACYQLNSFLKSFDDPLQISTIIEKITDSRKFVLKDGKIKVEGKNPCPLVPHTQKGLVKLIEQLSVYSYVIIVKLSDNEQDWWVFNKKLQDYFSVKVASIFSPAEFKAAPGFSSDTYEHGIVSATKVYEIFEGCSQNELIKEYLAYVEFCIVIEDSELLNLITGGEKLAGEDEKKCFFFPDLINKKKRPITLMDICDPYYSGWLLINHRDFGSRFLQSLLLRIIFKFVNDRTKSGERKLTLWKNGIFWHTRSGIDVLVEVINDRKVIALFRCNSDKCCRLAQLRSGVISVVRRVLTKYCMSDSAPLNVEEFYLYPPPTNFNDYQSYSANKKLRIEVSDMIESFRGEFDSRVVFNDYYNAANSDLSVKEFLGFDSYILLDNETLKSLKNNDKSSVNNVFSILDPQSTNFRIIFGSIYTCKKWCEKYNDKPVSELIAKLDKFSIFKLKDLPIV